MKSNLKMTLRKDPSGNIQTLPFIYMKRPGLFFLKKDTEKMMDIKTMMNCTEKDHAKGYQIRTASSTGV